MPMEVRCSLACQARADVSPEHAWGVPLEGRLNFRPEICGTRNGPDRRPKFCQSMASARQGHARQATSFAGDHSQVCRAECERSPGFTRMKMSRPASRAGQTHEDVQMESSTHSHTAPLRACGEPIVDVRSGGQVGHEGSEWLGFRPPLEN